MPAILTDESIFKFHTANYISQSLNRNQAPTTPRHSPPPCYHSSMPRNEFALTRSIYPYRLSLIVCIGISVLGVFAWAKTRDPNIFLVTLLVWLVTIATQYENTRYRIFWKDGVITQVSVNKFLTTISCPEITRIVQERSDLQNRLRMQRPLDRIAIYAGQGTKERHIDVSLRHFVSDDIRRLMHAIHEQRPDLAIPRNWAY